MTPAVPDYAYVLWILCLVMVCIVPVFAIENANWTFRNWWWNLTRARYWTDTVRQAYAINRVRDEVEAEYKKVHFRHNIHCPKCGRFAKQAEGWAEGMSDCRVHGIQARFMTHPSQGYVEVIVEELTPVIEAILEPAQAELTPLWDEDFDQEIVVDYVPDAEGLPVFTQPMHLEDLR